MRRSVVASLIGVVVLGSTLGSVRADESKLTTKPSLPNSFQTWMVTGKHAGRFHSPVCDFGLNAMVLVFVRESAASEPAVGTLLKKLDDTLKKHIGLEPGGCAVFLSDGGFRDAVDKGGDEFSKSLAAASKRKDELETTVQGLAKSKEIGQMVLGLANESAVNDYKLPEKADVVVLICYKHEIVARHDLPRDKLTAAETTKIVGDFDKLLTGLEYRPRSRRR